MSEEPWLFNELERAAAEFRAMPDEYKPVVTDGRRRLEDALPDAPGHGTGDHWVQPSLFDGDGESAEPRGNEEGKRERGARVGRPLLILTRQEVESKRARVMERIHLLEHYGLTDSEVYADLVDDLDDCDFLLGDK